MRCIICPEIYGNYYHLGFGSINFLMSNGTNYLFCEQIHLTLDIGISAVIEAFSNISRCW